MDTVTPPELAALAPWRTAVWALRAGYGALAVGLVGLVLVLAGRTPWVLAAGVVGWLVCAAVTVTGVLRAHAMAPAPRPGLWPMRCMLIGATVHRRPGTPRPERPTGVGPEQTSRPDPGRCRRERARASAGPGAVPWAFPVTALPALSALAAVCVIVFAAALLQRTVGFGFALLAVPLLTFAVPAKAAVVVALLVGTATSGWLLVHLRRDVVPEPARRLGIGAIVGAPVGVVILRVIAPDRLLLLVGVTTCVAAAWVVGSSRWGRPDGRAAPRWRAWSLGVVSGVLTTSVATNGPPVIYELRRRGLHGDAFRATVSAVFVLSDLVGIPLLAAAGLLTGATVAVAAISLVPCAAGIAVGARVSRRMAPGHFVWAADVLLLVTGVMTIVRALV